ncbi:MAG: phosphoglucosamine mutase [Lachnospiraceae bacterium]|jgi:phosphoglucosamine mutase|nr:phosphoglucosamine mutase [Lachnospiraceae bacterium]MEE3461080.1 phosphoglucosamine mutase [Lachnospiraceae bacterium]
MKYFGTDGFRGEANVNLNVEHAFKVGRYLGWYYGQGRKAKIVIGKDTRRSSYMFEDALSAGLTASGADVYLLHVTPTPSVSYVVRTERFDCGIMISASHNPYYDNGLKVINGDGRKMEEEVLEKIENYIDSPSDTIPYATRENIGCTVDYEIGRHRYIGYLMSLATRSFKHMNIGLDCANGSSYSVAKGVFDALGARTFAIGMNPNGTNINDDCGSTHIENLQRFVIDNRLDAGFAFDGDADRCLCIDDEGNIVDGDMIIYICGKYLQERGELKNNTVVGTVMSNMGLKKALAKHDIKVVTTAVGDKYVNECMTENGYSIGGEQSGHIIFSKYAVTGDGVLTSLMVMEVMLEKKMKLSELCKGYVKYPQVLKNVKVTDKNAAMNDPEVLKEGKLVSDELGDEGRLLLRASGTEPLVRVMVEAGDKKICNDMVDRVVNKIRERGFAV